MAYNPLSAEEIKEVIIKTAEAEFIKNGIQNTEMKIIAAKSKIGRSTLYRYFPQKEQLAFILAINVLKELMLKCFFVVLDKSLTGYEKVEQYSVKFVDALLENEMITTYLSEFDSAFINDYPAFPEVEEFLEIIRKNVLAISQCIDEGKRDGSIATNEDPDLYSATLFNTMLGLGQRLIPRRARISSDQGYSAETMIRLAINMLLQVIKT